MTDATVLEGYTVNDPQIAAQRRANISIKQLSHTAVRIMDMRKTRAFYEDLLGLPMISSQIADFDVVTGEKSNYIHCFFEMADGAYWLFSSLRKVSAGHWPNILMTPLSAIWVCVPTASNMSMTYTCGRRPQASTVILSTTTGVTRSI